VKCEDLSSGGFVIRWCRERFCVGDGGLDVILAAKLRGVETPRLEHHRPDQTRRVMLNYFNFSPNNINCVAVKIESLAFWLIKSSCKILGQQ
jgi:hypothetical protein